MEDPGFDAQGLFDSSYGPRSHSTRGYPAPTRAHWLDDPPDLSCKETTHQQPVDGRVTGRSRSGA